jgi:hypothetical protein
VNTQGWDGLRDDLGDVMSAKLGHKIHISDNNSRRARLWLVDPHCAWCGIETIWWEGAGGWKPHNAATLEHLDSLLSGQRRQSRGEPRSTIACSQCNYLRGLAEERALPDEIKQRRSHLHDVPRHTRVWIRYQLNHQLQEHA